MTITFRTAVAADTPQIAQFIRDPAEYEKRARKIRFDEAQLGERRCVPCPCADVIIGEVDSTSRAN